MAYQARTIKQDFLRRRSEIMVWRDLPNGQIESVYFTGDLTSTRVTLEEGVQPDVRPFIAYEDVLFIEIDGILKALHDLYREIHSLDQQTGVDAGHLEELRDALAVERRRIDSHWDHA